MLQGCAADGGLGESGSDQELEVRRCFGVPGAVVEVSGREFEAAVRGSWVGYMRCGERELRLGHMSDEHSAHSNRSHAMVMIL